MLKQRVWEAIEDLTSGISLNKGEKLLLNNFIRSHVSSQSLIPPSQESLANLEAKEYALTL
jgi:hypothetical protein